MHAVIQAHNTASHKLYSVHTDVYTCTVYTVPTCIIERERDNLCTILYTMLRTGSNRRFETIQCIYILYTYTNKKVRKEIAFNHTRASE